MDDIAKIRFAAAFIAFNFFVMIYQIFFNSGEDFWWPKLFVALIVGGIGAAIAWFAVNFLK